VSAESKEALSGNIENNTKVELSGFSFFLDFFLVLIAIALPAITYSVLWSITGSYNPLNWGEYFKLNAIIYGVVLPVTLFLCYRLSTSDIDAEKWLSKFIDLKEFENKKFLDCIFSHYTNVATIGLFWMILVFTLKPIAVDFGGLSLGALLGICMVIIITFYSLLFMKTALGLVRYNFGVYMAVSIILFLLDTQAIRLFLASVPKLAT